MLRGSTDFFKKTQVICNAGVFRGGGEAGWIPPIFAEIGIVIYLHIEGALYAQKSVPSWFLAVFDSKIDVC